MKKEKQCSRRVKYGHFFCGLTDHRMFMKESGLPETLADVPGGNNAKKGDVVTGDIANGVMGNVSSVSSAVVPEDSMVMDDNSDVESGVDTDQCVFDAFGTQCSSVGIHPDIECGIFKYCDKHVTPSEELVQEAIASSEDCAAKWIRGLLVLDEKIVAFSGGCIPKDLVAERLKLARKIGLGTRKEIWQ